MNYQQKISFAIIICVICFFSGLFAYDAGKNAGRAELVEQIRRTPETCVPGQIFTHDKEVFLCAQTSIWKSEQSELIRPAAEGIKIAVLDKAGRLVPIYSDLDMTTPQANPFMPDALGDFHFVGPPGYYVLLISGDRPYQVFLGKHPTKFRYDGFVLKGEIK